MDQWVDSGSRCDAVFDRGEPGHGSSDCQPCSCLPWPQGPEGTQLDHSMAAEFVERGWIHGHNWTAAGGLDRAEAFCRMVRCVDMIVGLERGIGAGGESDTARHLTQTGMPCHPDCCNRQARPPALWCNERRLPLRMPKSPCPPSSRSLCLPGVTLSSRQSSVPSTGAYGRWCAWRRSRPWRRIPG